MGFLRNLLIGEVDEPVAGVDCDCTHGTVSYCHTCEEWVDDCDCSPRRKR